MEAPTQGIADDQTRRPNGFSWLGLSLIATALLFLLTCLWLVGLQRPDPRNRSLSLITTTRSPTFNLPGPEIVERELSAAELAFGAEQVDRMVKDRPAMGRSVRNTDALWQFCARCFGGQAIGETVLWDSALPQDKGYDSENLGPFEGRKGFIRIRKNHDSAQTRGQPLSCEELWGCAVFELENLRNHRAFHSLYEMALKGQLTREDWVRENSKLEFSAFRRTAQDYLVLWRPLAITRQLSQTPARWGGGTPATYEAWIVQYNDPTGYPWDVFARYYDEQVLPYLRSAH